MPLQGHIINVSSIAAHEHYAGGSVYCGTKAFVTAFTNAMRHDLVGTNIRYASCLQILQMPAVNCFDCESVKMIDIAWLCRVTAISPGAVQTEFSNVRFKVHNMLGSSDCCIVLAIP